MATASDEIRVYWQPGCTSCLRTKEFLTKRGVPFVSRNVLADSGALDELAVFGLRQVPVVTRGHRQISPRLGTERLDRRFKRVS